MPNPLTDIIPARYRKYVYAGAFLGGLAWTAIQAADGDWRQAVALLAGSLVPLLAASNTAAPKPDERGVVTGASGLIAFLLAIFLILAILWLVGVRIHVG